MSNENSGFINNNIRVRFAPSPTGKLHIGGVRSAIFNWLFAKSQGGKFLLRIEDTDLARSTDEFSQDIIESMKWLGMQSDEKIVIQSQNQSKHHKLIQELIDQKKAYPCFCTEEEMNALRAQADTQAFKYPGICKNKNVNFSIEHEFEKLKNGSKPGMVVRFALPQDIKQTLSFDDMIKGLIEISSGVLDDFVILKSDFVPTYNFAVVADDIEMQISHIIRGEDHVINTFRQKLIYQALEQTEPKFGHMPMILGKNGERLSKRHGATAVSDYRASGYLPWAMINYLVRLGWSFGNAEIFSKEELLENFKIENTGKKSGIFDQDKLNWLNNHYIKQLSYEQFSQHLEMANATLSQKLQEIENVEAETLKKFFVIFKERFNTTIDLATALTNLFTIKPHATAEQINEEFGDKSVKMLLDFFDQSVALEMFNPAELQLLINDVVKRYGVKLPELAKPLRLLLSGQRDGPSVAEIAAIWGKEKIAAIASKF